MLKIKDKDKILKATKGNNSLHTGGKEYETFRMSHQKLEQVCEMTS